MCFYVRRPFRASSNCLTFKKGFYPSLWSSVPSGLFQVDSSLIFQNGISNDELKDAKGILRTGRGGVRQLPYA